MKIRNGFVSNSSSSSFVVEIRDWWSREHNKKETVVFLSKEEVEKLLEFGFKYTECPSPVQIEFHGGLEKELYPWAVEKETYQLGISVGCNEDNIVEFLLENDISFKGLCHYGHRSVIYKKGSKHFLEIRNPGLEFSMYDALGDVGRLYSTDALSDLIVKVEKKAFLKDCGRFRDEN